MRPLLALSLLAAPGLLACSESDPPPHFIDLSYQIRCIDCSMTALDETPHEISAVDGESDYDVSCRVEGSKPLLSFSVQGEANGDPFLFRITGASLGGKDPGSACTVTIKEGSNRYEGGCTADDPSSDRPCQFEAKRDGDVIKGSVLCRNIPNMSASTVTRDVVFPGSEDAAEFELHGCE